MFYLLLLAFVPLGIILIFTIVHYFKTSSNLKNQDSINNNVFKFLNNSNFKISKILYLNDNASYNQTETIKKFIAVDNESKQLCLVDYINESLIIIKFNEILNYEIYENGSNTTLGAGFGIWSGIFSAETYGMCKDLKLIIRLNRYDKSQVSYELITNTLFNLGVNKSSIMYKECITTLQEAVSFLEVIKNENKNN